jgi:hypothetical protein
MGYNHFLGIHYQHVTLHNKNFQHIQVRRLSETTLVMDRKWHYHHINLLLSRLLWRPLSPRNFSDSQHRYSLPLGRNRRNFSRLSILSPQRKIHSIRIRCRGRSQICARIQVLANCIDDPLRCYYCIGNLNFRTGT